MAHYSDEDDRDAAPYMDDRDIDIYRETQDIDTDVDNQDIDMYRKARSNKKYEEAYDASYEDDYAEYARGTKRRHRKRNWIPNVILLALILIVCGAIASEALDLSVDDAASALAAATSGADSENSSETESAETDAADSTDNPEETITEETVTEEEAQEQPEEEIDLSDIDEILEENGLTVMFDGNIFDTEWYQETLAAAGSTELDGVEEDEEIYRHYQLYGQGDGLTAYDTSSMEEETIQKLVAYEELVQQELDAQNGTGWTTITADICDTELVAIWNAESLITDAEDEATDDAMVSGDSGGDSSDLFAEETLAVLSEEAVSALSAAIAQIEDAGYDVGFVLLDLNTGAAISYRAGVEVYSASVIKAPYIFSLLEAEIEPTNSMYLAGNQSDNDAYVSIRTTYGNEIFAEWIADTGIPAVQSKTRYITTTPLDLARMFYKARNLLLGDETYSDWARNTFTDSLNSAAALTIGETKSVYSKAGWISASDGYSVSSYTNAAIVDDGENPYVISFMSNTPGWTGLIYAQDLLPVLDLIHDEMCGLTVDYSALDIVSEEASSNTSGDNGSGGDSEGAGSSGSSGNSSGMIDEDRKWSDGAPDPGAEGGPDWQEEDSNASGSGEGAANAGESGTTGSAGSGSDAMAPGSADSGGDAGGASAGPPAFAD